jgi:catechol 2,3-dioxygenase-like lactoylglutathione lyase family enzyme
MKLTHTTVWVRDQDEALEFFRKLGMDVREDVTNNGYRWLAVASPEQPEIGIVLSVPNSAADQETAKHVQDAVSKGMLSGLVFSTDDCYKTYEELKSKGVEFTLAAGKRPYGVDAAFRDPSGNQFRLLQTSKAWA